MAVYGDMLAAFPELMEELAVFKMDPNVGAGGYSRRHDERKFTGYFSWIKGGKMEVEGDLRTENQNGTLWERSGVDGKGVVRQGDYFERDNFLFVVNHDDGYSREGGFNVYSLQLVPAFSDKQLPYEVNIGAKDFH
jgi:hypothetical protein